MNISIKKVFLLISILTMFLISIPCFGVSFEKLKIKCKEETKKCSPPRKWRVSYADSQCKRAINVCKQVLDLNKNNALIYADIGFMYHKLGKDEEAIAWYNKAIKIDDNKSKFYARRCSAYYHLNKLDSALRDAKKLFSLNKKIPASNEMLGYIYDTKKDYGKALFYFERAYSFYKNKANKKKVKVLITKMGWKKHFGITTIEWKNAGFSLAEAIEWKEAGFTPNGAREWKKKDFSPLEAGKWKNTDIKPDEAHKWKKGNFSMEEVSEWKKFGFNTTAVWWKECGFTPEEGSKWKKIGFNVPITRSKDEVFYEKGQGAIEWKKAGFNPTEAIKWKKAGFDVTEAQERGSNFDEYIRLLKTGKVRAKILNDSKLKYNAKKNISNSLLTNPPLNPDGKFYIIYGNLEAKKGNSYRMKLKNYDPLYDSSYIYWSFMPINKDIENSLGNLRIGFIVTVVGKMIKPVKYITIFGKTKYRANFEAYSVESSGIFVDSGSSIKTGNGKESDNGFCFIATAAYDSYLDPHVKVLRNFRDKYLLTNTLGVKFVEFYYNISPPIANYIKRHEYLKLPIKWILTLVVYIVKYPITVILILIITGILLIIFKRRTMSIVRC